MDPITLIGGINGALSAVAAFVRMAERAKQAGEISADQLAAVKQAAQMSDAQVDRIVAEAQARIKAGGK